MQRLIADLRVPLPNLDPDIREQDVAVMRTSVGSGLGRETTPAGLDKQQGHQAAATQSPKAVTPSAVSPGQMALPSADDGERCETPADDGPGSAASRDRARARPDGRGLVRAQ